jgi:hypothetical protein
LNEKLTRYLNYLVEHQLRNDAGVLWVQNNLRGNAAAWVLAVRGYLRTMGTGDAGYLAFRRRWAWSDERVQRVLDSAAGTLYTQRIETVRNNFNAIPEMTGHTLHTGSLRRSLNTQANLFAGNWSVALLGADLLRQTEAEVARTTYPNEPTAAAAATLRRFILGAQLAAVDNPRTTRVEAVRSPTNATPGLSDHGRLSAVDFVVKQGRNTVAGADSAQITTWRRALATGMSFDTALQRAIGALNRDAGAVLFEGPLPAPDEPWHYTYLPIRDMEDAEDAAAPTD